MSTILVDNLTGKTTAGDITVTSEGGAATQSLQQGLAKAWANWNGQGTVALRDSFNNASLTDNGPGDYTLTIASAMSNVGYCRSGMAGMNSNSQENISQAQNQTAATTTATRYAVCYSDTNNEDAPYAGVVIHGDLA
jgi:hypothetical protein